MKWYDRFVIFLGIETSCDETAVAVLRHEGGRAVGLADRVASQALFHERHGGVVPEVACRRHIEQIVPLVQGVLSDAGCTFRQLGAIAVTVGPGLVGALLVGLSFAKALAYRLSIPLIPVHHLEGHIASIFIEQEVAFPCVALVVSGGHTNLYYMTAPGSLRLLGKTRDDAAGEALDKGARMLGFGYPGGPIIDLLAKKGDAKRFPFPRPQVGGYDFSFSGLKTAFMRMIANFKEQPTLPIQADLAASYQQAIVESLIEKTRSAAAQEGAKTILLCGGVSANSLLRRRITEEGNTLGVATAIPSPRYCMDNGMMIAMAGAMRYERGAVLAPLDMEPSPQMEMAG